MNDGYQGFVAIAVIQLAGFPGDRLRGNGPDEGGARIDQGSPASQSQNVDQLSQTPAALQESGRSGTPGPGPAQAGISGVGPERAMSGYGYKRTFWAEGSMSAFGGKADID